MSVQVLKGMLKLGVSVRSIFCMAVRKRERHADEVVVVIERDSPRDRLVATFFLLIVFGLLLYAAIRSR